MNLAKERVYANELILQLQMKKKKLLLISLLVLLVKIYNHLIIIQWEMFVVLIPNPGREDFMSLCRKMVKKEKDLNKMTCRIEGARDWKTAN